MCDPNLNAPGDKGLALFAESIRSSASLQRLTLEEGAAYQIIKGH